ARENLLGTCGGEILQDVVAADGLEELVGQRSAAGGETALGITASAAGRKSDEKRTRSGLALNRHLDDFGKLIGIEYLVAAPAMPGKTDRLEIGDLQIAIRARRCGRRDAPGKCER